MMPTVLLELFKIYFFNVISKITKSISFNFIHWNFIHMFYNLGELYRVLIEYVQWIHQNVSDFNKKVHINMGFESFLFKMLK